MGEKHKSIAFSCVCEPGEKMDFRGMIDHMKSAHAEEIEGKQVMIEMAYHVDGDTWYTTTDKITTGGGNVFFRHFVSER